MIKLPSFSPHLSLGALAAFFLPAAAAQAQLVSFEDYTEGVVNSTESQPVSFPGTNQGGWSNSTSTMHAAIAANSANGLAGSGQFMTIPTPSGSAASAYTMIAAKQTAIPVTGVTSISFDLRFVTHDGAESVGGGTQNMAGFAQTFPNGSEFSNANAGILFGQTGPTSFGYRVAGFGGTGSRLAPTFTDDGTRNTIPAPVVGNWYGITATIAPEFEGNRAVTLDLFDYASNTFWANHTFNVPMSQLGSVALEDSEGVVVRLTRNLTNDDYAGAIDNLSATVIPEPSTYALMIGIAGLTLAAIRRRRNA